MRKAEIPKGLAWAIANSPVLSKEKERQLLEKAKAGDNQAKNQLVTANLAWVWRVAERYRRRGIPFEDLFQLGVIGLIQAIDAYDMQYEVRITSYATASIRGRILLEIDTRAGVIKLPKKHKRLQIADPELQQAVERILNSLVSLSALGRSPNRRWSSEIEAGASCSAALREGSDVMEKASSKETSATVRRAVFRLPHREKLVVWLRLRGWPRKRVGSVIGITEEGVRKVEIRAHLKLREFLQSTQSDEDFQKSTPPANPMNIIDIQKLIQFLEVWDAEQELDKLGYRLRIVNSEGNACVTTRDFCTDRVNVSVSQGRILNVLSIG